LTGMFSCVESQDFGQYQDLEITPTMPVGLISYEVLETIINKASPGVSFNDDIIADRIIEGSISFQIVNTSSKTIEITVSFLGENDNELDKREFRVNRAIDEPIILDSIVPYNQSETHRVIKNISSIRLSVINLGDNASQPNLDDPKIILKSSAEFKIRLK